MSIYHFHFNFIYSYPCCYSVIIIPYTLYLFQLHRLVASYADALWARHAFLPHVRFYLHSKLKMDVGHPKHAFHIKTVCSYLKNISCLPLFRKNVQNLNTLGGRLGWGHFPCCVCRRCYPGGYPCSLVSKI